MKRPKLPRSIEFTRRSSNSRDRLTNPEIAQLLDCSLATVKIRVHRARSRLREALAAGCDFSLDERGVTVCAPQPPES